ncbi:hypothetical protein Hanom_Chr04g00282121 [Helianthus anomalus]
MLETIQPLFNSFFFNFFVRSIMKQNLNLGEFFPQFLELGVNTLSTSILLDGYLTELLKNEFDKCRSSSISHC